MASKNSGLKNTRPGSLTVTVVDSGDRLGVLRGAFVSLRREQDIDAASQSQPTAADIEDRDWDEVRRRNREERRAGFLRERRHDLFHPFGGNAAPQPGVTWGGTCTRRN